MRDLSRDHVLLFALLFLTLFASLFAGVVQMHRRNTMHHAVTAYPTATRPVVN